MAKKRSRRPPWPASPGPTSREQYRNFRERASASPTVDTGFLQDEPLTESTATLPKVDGALLEPTMHPRPEPRPLGTILMEYGTFALAILAALGAVGWLIWLIVGAQVHPLQTQIAVETEKIRQMEERSRSLAGTLKDEVRRLETLIEAKVAEFAERLKRGKR